MKKFILVMRDASLLLCGVSTLAGCLIERDAYVQFSHKPTVKSVKKELFVSLTNGILMLSDQDRLHLKMFKKQIDLGRPLKGEIIFYGLSPSEQTSQFKTQVDVMLGMETQRGGSLYTVYKTRADMISLGLSPGALIRLEQFRAVMPASPGFDDYTIDGHIPPEGEITFGYATASNLAVMVTHPQDLVQAKDLAPGDPHVATAAMDRLRTDKTKDLKVEKIQTTNG